MANTVFPVFDYGTGITGANRTRVRFCARFDGPPRSVRLTMDDIRSPPAVIADLGEYGFRILSTDGHSYPAGHSFNWSAANFPLGPIMELAPNAVKQPADLTVAYPRDEWHEDDGPVLWHILDEWGGLCEAPIVARGDEELEGMDPWPGYFTHWSRLPNMPRFPCRSAKIAPEGALICDDVAVGLAQQVA